MASGANRIYRGSFLATGAAKNVTEPGFKPVKVVIRTSAGQEMTWLDSMADAAGFKRVTAGTGSFVTSNGITPLTNGFTFGADAINVNGQTVYFEAFEG